MYVYVVCIYVWCVCWGEESPNGEGEWDGIDM